MVWLKETLDISNYNVDLYACIIYISTLLKKQLLPSPRKNRSF